MRILLVLSALILISCGPKNSPNIFQVDYTGWPTGKTTWHNNISIRCEDNCSTEQVAAINSNVLFYITAWETDNSRKVKQLNFGMVFDECECGKVGNDFAACWRAPGIIISTVNNNLDCEPVYHELEHQRLWEDNGDADPGHHDPRWATWSARQTQLRQEVDLCSK